MKVNEVILAAAALLGLEKEVGEYIEGEFGAGRGKTERLLICFNLVESQLALDYLPLLTQEVFSVNDGKIAYEQFSKNPSRVISVADGQGNRLAFRLYPTEIQVNKKQKTAVVDYAFLPQEKKLNEDSDYQSGVSVGLAAYGVAAEYCAAEGLYAEAAFWNKKYKESIAKSCALKRGGRMQSRRWV